MKGLETVLKQVPLEPGRKKPRRSRISSKRLHHRIIGQEDAVGQLVNAYQDDFGRHEAVRGRPLSNTGCYRGRRAPAKLGSSKRPAEILFENPERVSSKWIAGSFNTVTKLRKLIGSPPGYIGHRETLCGNHAGSARSVGIPKKLKLS
jgi:ATP-dependent Clp protease ATP-binding subunit ClpA